MTKVFSYCLFLSASIGFSAECLKVSAHIDGRSVLAIRGDKLVWQHLTWAAPGRHGTRDLPTVINDTTEWFPEWPDASTLENRATWPFTTVHSNVYQGIPKLEGDLSTISVDVISGRGPVTISSRIDGCSKEKTVAVEFDDEAFSDSADYTV